MSKKHRDRAKDQHTAHHDEPPAAKRHGDTGMVYTVRIEPNPQEDKNRANEEKYREGQLDVARGQLRASKVLNWISGVGGGIAFLALCALIYNAKLINL